MKKIVYISFSQLNEGLYRALCIDDFLDLGVEVDYLDITSLLFNNATYKQKFSFVQNIDSYQELENYIILNDNNSVLYNIQLHYETRFFKLFKLFKKYNCRQSTFEIGYLPVPDTSSRMRTYLKRPIVLVKKIIDRVLDIIYVKFGLINLEYDVKFTAGEVAYLLAKETAKQIVQINFVDYEKNMEYIESEDKDADKKYFVFLDIFLHKHSDHQFSENSNIKRFNGERYIQTLNNFFEYIEKTYDTEVIIAAHPKSNYQNTEFSKRKIIRNKTEGLVLNAQAVISHHSTSISYAVLNKKPIIFIYTDEIKKNMSNVFLYTDTFANYLQMPIVNIDGSLESSFSFNVNDKVYDKYKYDFLTTTKIENLHNKEIIGQFLKDDDVFVI